MMISEDEMAADDIWIGIDRMGTYLRIECTWHFLRHQVHQVIS